MVNEVLLKASCLKVRTTIFLTQDCQGYSICRCLSWRDLNTLIKKYVAVIH